MQLIEMDFAYYICLWNMIVYLVIFPFVFKCP